MLGEYDHGQGDIYTALTFRNLIDIVRTPEIFSRLSAGEKAELLKILVLYTKGNIEALKNPDVFGTDERYIAKRL